MRQGARKREEEVDEEGKCSRGRRDRKRKRRRLGDKNAHIQFFITKKLFLHHKF